MIGISSQYRTIGHSMFVFIVQLPDARHDRRSATGSRPAREIARGVPDEKPDNVSGRDARGQGLVAARFGAGCSLAVQGGPWF